MATRNINLTEKLDAFVKEQVESGNYQNASEVLRDGLRLLMARQERHESKLRALREAAEEGFRQIEAGEYYEIQSGDDLRDFFDALERDVEAVAGEDE